MRATFRRLLSAFAGLALVGGGLLALAPTAAADVTYVPDRWNGKVVYLSEACHDRGDTICHTNTGCDGFSENANAYLLAVSAATQRDPDHMNLLERGYKVSEIDSAARQWNASAHDGRIMMVAPRREEAENGRPVHR